MLDLAGCKRMAVIGGGTAGLFAAITLRRIFNPATVEVTLVESPDIGVIGVGEGGLLNFIDALHRNKIPEDEFVRETGAAWKLGFAYEGWRGGGRQDVFFHLFGGPGMPEAEWLHNGIYPMLAARIAQGRELHTIVPAFEAIARTAPQDEIRALIDSGKSGLTASYQFDSYRVASYLKKVALSRGVVYRQGHVEGLEQDERGHVKAVRVNGEALPVDFLVDSTGLGRIAIEKTFHSPWNSFTDWLLLDRAIPFHLPSPGPNPSLLSRSVAMNAGWMWQIPIQERIGAGYVFSSRHISEEQALAEVEAHVGHSITPMPTIPFHAGHFAKVWIKNVIALGLSAGFVEPLEATSIGQMLESLRNFERLLVDCGGVVSDKVIDDFNRANAQSWAGIRDFLRMHYDCPRRDTPFWRDVAATPYPDSYAELKQIFQRRMPRSSDISVYQGLDWARMFHVINWMFVAAPLGVMTKNAGQLDLSRLPPDVRAKANI